MRPVAIGSTFPHVAKTMFTTTAGVKLLTSDDTLSNGFLSLGNMLPSSLEDCMGGLPSVEAGVLQAATINAQGADEIARIYHQYRVYAFRCILRLRNITPQVSNENAYTIPTHVIPNAATPTSNTHPGYAVPAHDHVHYAQQTIWVAIIPTTTSTSACTTWSEVVNHPFAIISKQKSGGVNSAWNFLKMPEIHIPSFVRTFNSEAPGTVGQELHKREFNQSGGIVGSDIWYQVYILDANSYSDVTDIEVEGTMYLQQKTLLYKSVSTSGSLMELLGDEGAGDYGDLQPNTVEQS